MELSLPAWLGALCGMIVAAAIYVPGIRIMERHLRASSDAKTPEQRSAFEDRLSLARRAVLGFDMAAFAVLGYWVGSLLAGRMSGAGGG
jgi:hypothetical protein